MKKLIISTFILGLSTSAFANGEDLDKLFSFGAEETLTTSAQPQVGSSKESEVQSIFENYDGNS